LSAQIIESIHVEALKKELEQQSRDEMNHAKILANIIIQPVGTPTTKLRDFDLRFLTSVRRSNRSSV
jgi:bacterioferritin (cytochrome b1)